MPNFKEDVKFHEELRQCANVAYGGKKDRLPEGYSLSEPPYHDTASGLDAYVIKHDDKIIISYRGSQQATDYIQDFGLWRDKGTPEQLKQAKVFRDQVANNAKYKDKEIILTGDSLGAACATYTGAISGDKTVGFNTYGIGNFVKKEGYEIKSDNIVNYCNRGDIISSYNSENIVGECYEIDSVYANNHPVILKDHIYTNQNPISQQKTINKDDLGYPNEFENMINFWEKVSDKIKESVKATAKWQEQHMYSEREIYGELFQQFLDKYNQSTKQEASLNNSTFGGYRENNGQGEIYVKEYRRADGTLVKAHWRSYSGGFDPNKRLSEMQEPELGNAIDFWMDEDKFI